MKERGARMEEGGGRREEGGGRREDRAERRDESVAYDVASMRDMSVPCIRARAPAPSGWRR
jgi:hypothetical protein